MGPPEATEDVKAIVAVLRRRDHSRENPPIQIGLERTNLRGSRASKIHLTSAALTGAQLQGVDLRGAQLQGADLRGAQLDEANLEGADLTGASYTVQTKWPPGFNVENAGLLLSEV